MNVVGRARAVTIAAFYTLVGPLIGSGLILLVFLPAALRDEARGIETDFGQFAILLCLFGYVLGGPAALMSGVYLARQALKYGGFSAWDAAYAGLVATTITCALLAVAILMSKHHAEPPIGVFTLLVALGAISAVLCRLMLRWTRILTRPPNSRSAN